MIHKFKIAFACFIAMILFIISSCKNFTSTNNTTAQDSTASLSEPLYKKMNGSWANKRSAFTVNIDTKAGTYNGVEFGESFNEQIRIDSTVGNSVFFKVNGKKLVCQFISSDDVIFTKEGGIALELRRVKL